MKQMLITAALLLAMTLPAFAAAPDLVIENYKFDFGQVYQGERVEHVYRFRNAGDAPLRIEKVRSSCGCTAALASAEIIAPGEQGEVKAVFDSTRFRGRVTKTIYLYTDDPVHRETHFTLSGEVLAKLVANPAKLVFDNLSPGVRAEGDHRRYQPGAGESATGSSQNLHRRADGDSGGEHPGAGGDDSVADHGAAEGRRHPFQRICLCPRDRHSGSRVAYPDSGGGPLMSARN